MQWVVMQRNVMQDAVLQARTVQKTVMQDAVLHAGVMQTVMHGAVYVLVWTKKCGTIGSFVGTELTSL